MIQRPPPPKSVLEYNLIWVYLPRFRRGFPLRIISGFLSERVNIYAAVRNENALAAKHPMAVEWAFLRSIFRRRHADDI